MKKVILVLVILFTCQLFAGGPVGELNQMQGRKVEVNYRHYDKKVQGTLKEATQSGIVLFANGNQKIFIFYDAIASIKDLFNSKEE